MFGFVNCKKQTISGKDGRIKIDDYLCKGLRNASNAEKKCQKN
jgi:hypothetical protein